MATWLQWISFYNKSLEIKVSSFKLAILFRQAVKVLALVKQSNGLAVRPVDIEPTVASELFTKFEQEITSSTTLKSVKEETLVAIDMKTTKVVRKTEAFTLPLTVQVSFTDKQSVQAALDVAFSAAFPGEL